MSLTTVEIPVRFHLSLNVSNVNKAVSYFEKVFGLPPAKHRPDYAKFELDSPPLVLSLEPRPPGQFGSLNHIGFRFADAAQLVDAQARLERSGISTQREEGVECCYARQTKFWLHDFDQRLWEFYTLDEDIEHRGMGQDVEEIMPAGQLVSLGNDEPKSYQHLMGSPFEISGGPYDEILLRGSFNIPVSTEQIQTFLKQAAEQLRPGGKITLHMLTTETPITKPISLTGPAAYVKYVPVRTELMSLISQAGLHDVELTTFRGGACFQFDGELLRETKIEAHKPTVSCGQTCDVIYKGPFVQITDDQGQTYKRGESTTIKHSRWEELLKTPFKDAFTLMSREAKVSCGT